MVQELEELGQGRVRLPLRGLQGALQLQNLAVGDRVFKTADSELQAAGEAAAVAYGLHWLPFALPPPFGQPFLFQCLHRVAPPLI